MLPSKLLAVGLFVDVKLNVTAINFTEVFRLLNLMEEFTNNLSNTLLLPISRALSSPLL